MATKLEQYSALFVSWDAFVATVVASNDTGTSVSFDEMTQDAIHLTQATTVGAVTTTNTIVVTRAQALWLIDQITRLCVTDPG